MNPKFNPFYTYPYELQVPLYLMQPNQYLTSFMTYWISTQWYYISLNYLKFHLTHPNFSNKICLDRVIFKRITKHKSLLINKLIGSQYKSVNVNSIIHSKISTDYTIGIWIFMSLISHSQINVNSLIKWTG